MLNSHPAALALTTRVCFQIHDFLLSTYRTMPFISLVSFLLFQFRYFSFVFLAKLPWLKLPPQFQTVLRNVECLSHSWSLRKDYSLVFPHSGCEPWVFPSALHHAKEATSVSGWQSVFITKGSGLHQLFAVYFKTIEVIVELLSSVLLIWCIKVVFLCWPTFIFLT